jgi:hypothetical protein
VSLQNPLKDPGWILLVLLVAFALSAMFLLFGDRIR